MSSIFIYVKVSDSCSLKNLESVWDASGVKKTKFHFPFLLHIERRSDGRRKMLWQYRAVSWGERTDLCDTV